MARLFRLVLLALLLPLAAWGAGLHPPHAAIATAHPLATEAGHEILLHGGNAFDAAVTVAAALAVVEPYSSGLGGGGFFLLHRAADSLEVMIDARERAPLAATADMYLDDNGDPKPGASLNGPLAAAIPGLPAGLVHIAAEYGRLGLARDLAPAIRLARQGFPVSARYRRMAERRREALSASPAAAQVFLEKGFVPDKGYLIKQPDLAATLAQLCDEKRGGFYRGPIAARLVKGVRAAGGIWGLRDLAEYRIVERKPVYGTYRNVRISSAALPSSGGIVLVEMLNILQGFDLDRLDPVERARVIVEAMRLAYRDRARYLGDRDYVVVDTARLLSPAHAVELRRVIRQRTTGSDPAPAVSEREGGTHTTHFSVIDREGNRVAATLSINGPFGSAFMPPGTGVVLNNEMDDFVMKPGIPNLYGLVGSKVNAIAPGKRPLSSMTPTFLESRNAIVVLGTPGGSRIISMVLLATLDFAHGRGDVRQWVTRPRFHHQYLPDQVEYEPGAFTEQQLTALRRRGYRFRARTAGYGNMQAVVWYKKEGRVEAASDPRGEGSARVE